MTAIHSLAAATARIAEALLAVHLAQLVEGFLAEDLRKRASARHRA